MDKGYENERFQSLSIKSSVVNKFRKYSRQINRSQSLTLLYMLEFFEYNQIAPTEMLGPGMRTLESTIKKRINALIAIIRDIEKQQTQPTKAMLDALFESLPEKTQYTSKNSLDQAFQNFKHIPKVAAQSTPIDHIDIRKILSNTNLVQPALGKPYWKVSLSSSEITRLKSKYHVYNH